jgi:hypothetical protein
MKTKSATWSRSGRRSWPGWRRSSHPRSLMAAPRPAPRSAGLRLRPSTSSRTRATPRSPGSARRARGLPVPRADVEDAHPGALQPRAGPPLVRRGRREALQLDQGRARAPRRRGVALQDRARLERRHRAVLDEHPSAAAWTTRPARPTSRPTSRARKWRTRAEARRARRSLQELRLLGRLWGAPGGLLPRRSAVRCRGGRRPSATPPPRGPLRSGRRSHGSAGAATGSCCLTAV